VEKDTKEIIYYKSLICPRCIPMSIFLKDLKKDYPEITVKEVEIITHIKTAKQAHIHSIPVIEVAKKRFYKAPSRNDVLPLLGIRR